MIARLTRVHSVWFSLCCCVAPQAEAKDSPFFVQTTLAFKSEAGAAEYEKWFGDVVASRAPYASMYLLTRTADPLVYLQFEIYRSSAAFVEQHNDDSSVQSLAKFKAIQDHIDFDRTSVKVAGKVSEAARVSLASMRAVSHSRTGGHTLLAGKNDTDEDCIILMSTFRALDEDKADTYKRAFEQVAPSMKPFASTYFQCKDPADGVTFSEVMVFRNLEAFENHYSSKAIVEGLMPTVAETLDLESTQIIAVSNVVASEAGAVRRALDGVNCSYVERVQGYAFRRAPE